MDKQAQTIQNMFSDIAGSYDRANTVLSLGIHHIWKKKLVRLSGARSGQNVLDCATGTGDLALLFKKTVGSKGQVVGTDFCQSMLDQAPMKAEKENLEIQFQWADVTQLPFENNQFDIASISFGIRNVENRNKAYQEMARVTKPQGVVMILEFGQVKAPVIGPLYNLYSQKILPWIGGLISGRKEAYQYLNDSSQVFPCGEALKKEIMATGLYQNVEIYPLQWGLAFIYRCQTL